MNILTRLKDNDKGIAATEFALIAPVLLGLIMGSVDAGLLMQLKNNMTTEARVIARDVALGNIAETSAAESRLTSRLNAYAELEYFVEVDRVPDPSDPESFMVLVVVALSAAEVDSYGLTGIIAPDGMVVATQMRALE